MNKLTVVFDSLATGVEITADALRLIGVGVHWPAIDEDISVASLLRTH